MTPNRKAFLDMLATSEGTIGKGDDGYNVLVGGALFSPYDDHPNILVDLGHGLKSTAAGRYQFLHRTWEALKAQLGLPDFSPASQDEAALELVRQRHAIADVDSGRFNDAVMKCAPIWASLPDAGYGQRENTLASLREVYIAHGGSVA